MRPTSKFLIGLVLSLALLTWITSVLVQRTTHRWFENDVRLRAELVVGGSRELLTAHWSKDDRKELGRILGEMTRDERIMAAAACNADLTLLFSTPGFPAKYSCGQVGPQLMPASHVPAEKWASWHESTSLPGGSVLISGIPVTNAGDTLGFVVLVHDLSYAERRESNTQRFVLLAVGGSLATLAIGSGLLWTIR